MSRARQIQAIRQRYDHSAGEPPSPTTPYGTTRFTRGEVGVLLDEINHLTLLLADLHATKQTKEQVIAEAVKLFRVTDGVLEQRRPDGLWQQVMTLE